MWWSRKDELKLRREQALQDGIKAWRISVVNAMLAETYHNRADFPRPYRWSISELSQLSGVEIQTVSEHEQNRDRP